MRIESHTTVERWTKPARPEDQPEAGYAEWLAAEIEAGIAELDAGKGIPAAEVWRSLGLE
jgi:hypothetical protein